MTNSDCLNSRVLILAPIGRDAPAIADVLRRAGLESLICTDARALAVALEAGAGAVLAAEEALFGRISAELTSWVELQEPWSDMPFVMLTSRQARSEVNNWRPGMLNRLRNASLLERPLDALTLSSAARGAVRSRQRQYEVQAYLASRLAGADMLEHLVAVRTSELKDANATLRVQMAEREKAEDALRQSQKMEAVGQLTGGIAHDFNNMLTGISGSLELIQTKIGRGQTDGLERYVAAARVAADRAAALTHRLLAFSRRQTLSPKPTEAHALISAMEELIRGTLGPAITLNLMRADNLWVTICDPNQLENAVLNLVINARDAMPDGGMLTIRLANVHLDDAAAARQGDVEAGQYVVVSVIDTGSGMHPDVVARAFDPFFTTKPTGAGTGLGLSMVYGFARQSAGHVRIDSELGHGTSVSLFLPRYVGVAAQDEHRADHGDMPRSHAGETVLVVDDEPAIRMLVCEVLGDLGYASAEAEDARAGLHMLRSGSPFDLLITDVGLPNGMNGRQLADAARKARPDLPVLFITGYAENAAIGGGQLDPGMEVITKPFALDALATKIRMMIASPVQ